MSRIAVLSMDLQRLRERKREAWEAYALAKHEYNVVADELTTLLVERGKHDH